TVVPSLRATTTCLARRTASCWETVDWSSPSAAWSSWTLRSRTRRTSRSRIRMGWARALKKSALKRWRSDAGTDPESNETLIYKYSHIVNEQSRVRPPRGSRERPAHDVLPVVLEQRRAWYGPARKPGEGRR